MGVGVLALQGDYAAHSQALAEIGVPCREVRTRSELERCTALVIPGGESTAMIRLWAAEGLDELIVTLVQRGMPVLATCAGVILLAARVRPAQPSLGLLDLEVERNAYGRQVASAVETVDLDPVFGEPSTMDGVFIRAPRILDHGPGVEVLGYAKGDAVLVRQGGLLAATYHPELSRDRRVHRLFARVVEESHV